MPTTAVGYLKGHAAAQAPHQTAALRIKGHVQTRTVQCVRLTEIRQAATVTAFIYHRLINSGGGRCAKNGEHAGETSRAAPVCHVTGEGADLIEARAVKRIQRKVTVRMAPIVYLQLTPLHHVAARVQQLNVEHAATNAGTVPVSTHHIGREPHLLAHEVPRIVEMEVDFLLNHVTCRGHHARHAPEEAVQIRQSTHCSSHNRDAS